ncbi:MAG: restriction endonuclease subunit S [Ignavibacteriaceae bacterium]
MPSNLPSNWSWIKLGEVCETTSGGTPSRNNHKYYKGDIPWLKSGELNFNTIYNTEEKITKEALDGSSAKVLPKGTLLIALYGATVGRLAFLGIEAATNQAVAAIYTPQNLSNKFLYWFLFSYRDKLLKQRIGGAQPNISQGTLKNITIPLPPFPIQQKIVEKIEQLFSELDNGVASLKKAKEQIKIYRQTVLASAFSGRLCRNLIYQIPFGEQKNFINEIPTNSSPDHLNPIQVRNSNNKDDLLRVRQEVKIEHLPYKQKTNIAEDRMYGIQEVTIINKVAEPQTQYGLNQNSLDSKISRIKSENKSSESVNLENPGSDNYANNLPEGWKWVKLGELSELITKGASPRWQGFEYVNDETQTLFVTSENVRNNFLDISKEKFLEDSFNSKQKRSILKKGDVLFNLVGASIGRASVFNIERKANINQAVALIRLKESLNKNYLSYYLNSENAKRNYMNEIVDVARANLSLTDTANIKIPYCPVEQQLQIVEEIEKRFSEADNLEKAIDESLAKAESLRQSILKQAFEGRLV